ncbi:MAG: UUP1 family membrane protein [Rhodospirillales bacterium]|nr:UUP1 family membrane protein [Rhodospirillales bacterium]
MMNRHVYLLAAVLFSIGIGFFSYKTLVIGWPVTAEQKTELWEVEAMVSFNAKGGPAKLSLHLPHNASRFAVIDQSFVSRGYGLSTVDNGVNRLANLSVRKASGKQALYYRYTVTRGGAGIAEDPGGEPAVVNPKFSEPEKIAAQGIIRAAELYSADTETFVVQILQRLAGAGKPRANMVLLGPNPTERKKAAVAAKVLGLAKLPARSVHGLALGLDRRHAKFSHWLEVHNGKAWIPFLPEATGPGLPADWFAWWRGPFPFVSVSGGDLPQTTVTVNRVKNLTLNLIRSFGETAKNPALTWSLFGLPLQTQLVFRVLLTVPLGVFLLVLLRNVVGVKTFGTFMPVLIALAFRETGLVWGIILFTVLVSGGLVVRLYLEHLKLLLVPRLGAVVIVVILLMALLSLVTHKIGIVSGLSVALFPMVILAMTIERISIVWDERGPGEAMTEGLGSLIVAVLCFIAMSNNQIEHLVFVFPELLLVLLAATVLLGRYSGYRLTELFRFRVLSGKGK